jgi:hypothetical protein
MSEDRRPTSDVRRPTNGGTETRFDRAIDRAVQEMLAVEPPAGLRGRVLQRIDESSAVGPMASAFRRKNDVGRKILWTAVPLGAAAVLALALLLPRTESQPQPRATIAGNPTAPRVDTVPPRVQTPPGTTVARTVPPAPRRVEARATRPAGVVAAAAAETDVIFGASPDFPRVNALSIAPLTVSTLTTVSPVAPRELTLDPIAAPAPLEIEPLPLTPPSRHEQERP